MGGEKLNPKAMSEILSDGAPIPLLREICHKIVAGFARHFRVHEIGSGDLTGKVFIGDKLRWDNYFFSVLDIHRLNHPKWGEVEIYEVSPDQEVDCEDLGHLEESEDIFWSFTGPFKTREELIKDLSK